jgi:ribosomal 50S subunit-recycling heat shock protein
LFSFAAAASQEVRRHFSSQEDKTMRLDKYLKVSRLIKRRTVANEVADAGRILINGKIAKASQAVKAGDVIEVTFGNRPIKVRVLSDVEPRTKDVAREMYEIISE